jgi:hypothetical protein
MTIVMDNIQYMTLSDAIKTHPTSGMLWIDDKPYTYDVDMTGIIAYVYNSNNEIDYTVTLDPRMQPNKIKESVKTLNRMARHIDKTTGIQSKVLYIKEQKDTFDLSIQIKYGSLSFANLQKLSDVFMTKDINIRSENNGTGCCTGHEAGEYCYCGDVESYITISICNAKWDKWLKL